ncbi:hypothetical protein ACFUNF_34900 [Streptomyces sp. NPDC057291]|uniref:hypothetical protein n=1 Tax=Streptomyces sp. NPDC057291 TaxID=3346087 RepID=UPI0036290327
MISSEQFKRIRKIFSGSTMFPADVPAPASGWIARLTGTRHITVARLRAGAWRTVRLFSVGAIKGFGAQVGGALAACLLLHLTGLNLQDCLLW